jgi:hypothetical protein
LQVVQQGDPLQEILLVGWGLRALANDVHHWPPDKCGLVFRSLDIAGDDEECARNAALIQQRDIDSSVAQSVFCFAGFQQLPLHLCCGYLFSLLSWAEG